MTMPTPKRRITVDLFSLGFYWDGLFFLEGCLKKINVFFGLFFWKSVLKKYHFFDGCFTLFGVCLFFLGVV